MRLREALASALHLVVVLSYFAICGFIWILPSRPDWRLTGMLWFESQPEMLYWIGAVFGIVGFFFLFGFFGVGRGRFLRLEMKSHPATIDAKLIQKAIEECFKVHFPHSFRSTDVVVVAKKRLEVSVDMFPLKEELFGQVEEKLGALMRERFGYSQPFTLFVRSNDIPK